MKRMSRGGPTLRIAIVGAITFLFVASLLLSQPITIINRDALPGGVTVGSDGNLWFTDLGTSDLDRLTLSGALTRFPGPTPLIFENSISLASGADGNLWIAGSYSNTVIRSTTAGVMTSFPLPQANQWPLVVTSGPDGNLWLSVVSATSGIARMTTAGAVTEFGQSFPRLNDITAGPDGRIWFTEENPNGLGWISTDGSAIGSFPLPAGEGTPGSITAGQDGALWFTETLPAKVGRMTTTGSFTSYPVPPPYADYYPFAIARGPDGNIWFGAGSAIGRITPAGQVTVSGPLPNIGGCCDDLYPTLTGGGIVSGPDGNIYFSAHQRLCIGCPGDAGAILRVNLSPTTSSIPALDWRGFAALAALLAGVGFFALRRAGS